MRQLSRRGFIKVAALSGGGLVLSTQLSGCGSEAVLPDAAAGALRPNAFLQLLPDNSIILQFHKAEMGQGTATGMATLVAEEIGVDPLSLKLEHAVNHSAYADPDSMMTGGSASMKANFTALRQAGAVLRELVLSAAVQKLKVDRDRLDIVDGAIYLDGKDSGVRPGELAAIAAGLPVPDQSKVKLRDAADFRYIGHDSTRVDALAKVTGQAQYSIDQGWDGVAVAAVQRCPHFGGSLASVDEAPAQQAPGVRQVIRLEDKIAVLADSYWQARTAVALLKPKWNKGAAGGLNSAQITAQQRALITAGEGKQVRDDGKLPGADANWIEAEYRAPFMAHAAMEPLCCVARVTAQGVDIWAGNQGPDILAVQVAGALGRSKSEVRVHNAWLGGAFGRRLSSDFAVEAALIAQAAGEPVKVQWSREDDMQHDNYRPAAMTRFRAAIKNKQVVAVDAGMASPSLIAAVIPEMGAGYAPWMPEGMLKWVGGMAGNSDTTSTEGIVSSDYQFDAFHVRYVAQKQAVPVGFWRSVGQSQNAFFMESFIDEMAHAVGADPVAFRLQHLAEDSPRRRVLNEVVKMSGWGSAPPGRFQGVAVVEAFSTKVAQVAEISIERGSIKVHKVFCAVDCGLAVNPDVVRMQMESGIIFGLSAALKNAITIEDGAVQQSNFHDYQVLRMHETPEITVQIVSGGELPTGVGEPGVPPIAPAVANAVFAATGQRLREMPLRLS